MLRRARPRRSGFTLIELMVSLAIIAVMVLAVAPSLSEMLADNRQSSAAWDIIRLARRARASATSSGAAHLLRFRNTDTQAGARQLGTIMVYAGMNSKCAQTPWAPTFQEPVVANSGLGPHEVFTMAYFNPRDFGSVPTKADTNRQVIWYELRQGAEAAAEHTVGLQLCYQPNGEIYSATTSNATGLAVQSINFLLTIRRAINGAARGVDRQVLFPVGGNARLR